MGTIILKDMKFYAYHGCFKEEKIMGTNFSIDLKLESDTEKAEEKDDINYTIDYQKVYSIIKQQMQIKSNLIENVAHRIMEELINQFPKINKAEIIVKKLNPPIGGKVANVSFQLNYP